MTLKTPGGTAPTPGGGKVSDGTYYLTQLNLYGNPPGGMSGTEQEVMVISGSSVEVDETDSIYGEHQLKAGVSFSSATRAATLTPTCGTYPFGSSLDYTANGNNLYLYATVTTLTGTYVFEQVLTKQ